MDVGASQHQDVYHQLQTSRAQQTPSSTNTSAPSETGLRTMVQRDGEGDNTGKRDESSDYRVVALPATQHQQNAPVNFCSNVVITSKYTTWSFLPLFMFESFRKLANAYFLLVSILQCIRTISNTNGVPTTLPVLVLILSVDGILAIIEDRRRHLADKEANTAQCYVLKETYTGSKDTLNRTGNSEDSDVVRMHWAALTVGSVVKLHNRETAPADLLILAVAEPNPSEPAGICYVETKSLDGETNLKLRHACDATLHVRTPAQVAALSGQLRCENPNKAIGRFDGTLSVLGGAKTAELHPQPIAIKNVLLRGCQLRNTDWIYGLVVNTGPDTKIMQSATATRPKWSSINETVNRMIIWLFLLLCLLCSVATTIQVIWLSQHVDESWYLTWSPTMTSQWFVGFGYYFLLMYQMIPVSLYVTISMVMFFQSIFMVWDLDVYYEELDVRMGVRSMGLNEELGQISYVFSDKTGTLTCNVMEFRKCSINGVSYGTGMTEIGRAALRRKGVAVPIESEPDPATRHTTIPYVNFEDVRLFNALERPLIDDKPNREAEFFMHLSLCQTVIPEVVEGTSEVRFSASSPDEQALVSGAKFFGFSFESRGLGIARVRVTRPELIRRYTNDTRSSNALLEFKILDVLEFTSDRKRMSVVVRYPNGEYWVLTKGADNVIFPMLAKEKSDSEVLKETMRHLEVFGDDGLRTLTIAQRRVDEKTYLNWSERFKQANSSLEEIEKRKNGEANMIDQLMTEIERDLELLGATAIEDKLQANVPTCIANLMRAGMCVWMLTGDKQETAINISYACQLMDNDMQQFVFNCSMYPTTDAIYSQLCTANAQVQRGNGRHALVIDGECLELTLEDERCQQEFLALAMACDAVVCCRVSPSQKAEVVTLVRTANKKVRTLAIGDGANDVAMIQRAHVGVGISGQEGMQAVNSSDYAIGQFYFLEKLLLHHGRLNYKRMSTLVGYMFYKNIVMVLAQYFYMFCTGSSGQKFYGELGFQMYNVMYTSMPIIVLGVFDYDVPFEVSRLFPELYLVGPRMELFNNYTFFKWICSAAYESAVIFVFVIFAFNENYSNAGSAPMVQYGLLAFTMVVLIANIKLIMVQMSWNAYSFVVWTTGVVAYLPLTPIFSSYWITLFSTEFGSFQNTLGQETYWLILPVCLVVALLRHFTWTAICRRFYPDPWQIVQEQYVLFQGKHSRQNRELSRNDMEAGVSGINGILQGNETAYVNSSSPSRGYNGSQYTGKTRGSGSGFAFSYDPQTSLAESYMSTHEVRQSASAMNDAENRGRKSREDSRSSDYGSSRSAAVVNPTKGSLSTGLFV
ncbi:p-type atpase (p-atpase) superfamily [Plasmopara halstedii]|uniref:Phospholipid-transporting ATPase n=1 Tax=Plasmopara halstedii TaxID=4781 RepID=A0A0P1ASU1_PLAHL|nr:p-type atpase (p-atpase) superfamily [Plasmopara halstedii]CEG45204.1 p-type atpase (p-atpase) superfamily [Plasmopara halstedii]|eukprot:XP_024581573.1 p-type atpase (p-atpase) superfamily [Plasmopara halstedii]